jgi:hypothetical protein
MQSKNGHISTKIWITTEPWESSIRYQISIRRTQIKIYKTLARPVLTYGSEAWTIRKSDRTRITSNEMKFLRRTEGYTKLDKKRYTESLWELKINSVLEHIDQYRNNWKQHVQRMDWSHIPWQMMTYHPKGKRPLKRCRETIRGHWRLICVRRRRKKKKNGHILQILESGKLLHCNTKWERDWKRLAAEVS